jgi:DNA-binding beta-propeller fold protein YncE
MVTIRCRQCASGVAIVAALLGACAPPPPEKSLEPAARPEEARRVWPRAPEVPRYAYVGELTGESNFRAEPGAVARRAQGLFAWIVGLGSEPEPDLVLQRPQAGVSGPDGRIYVTDVSHQAVLVFDQAGQRVRVWGLARPLERFAAPIGVALGPGEGEVLVTDAEIGGIARDPRRGLVYVADTRAHDVKVFDDEGRLVDVFGRRGTGPGEFNAPTHLAFARDHLYVTDTLNSRIQVLDVDGRISETFGERGLYVGNLARPKGIAVDDEGNVYVVESYYDHLLVYDERGRFMLPIGGTGHEPGQFYLPSGVWVDERNRVYVADMFNGRISIFQFLGGG